MNTFDKKIFDANENICKSIALITEDEVGYFSQNILKALRPLVEAIICRIYSDFEEQNCSDQDYTKKAVKYIKGEGEKFLFLRRFHDSLQVTVSHDIPDEETSLRLMNRYYEWLFRLRQYAYDAYGMRILYNLEDYPLIKNDPLKEYHKKIVEKIRAAEYHRGEPTDRFYIRKTKAFAVAGKLYYEVTLVPADDFSSKFNRFIAFSDREIPSYYAIKLSFIESEIDIINRKMPIRIIDEFKVAIRPVEFTDIANILNIKKVSTGAREYHIAMDYLTKTGLSFTEIIDFDDDRYNSLKTKFASVAKSSNLFAALDICRDFSKSKRKGYVILRYLLLRLRHKIMREQFCLESNTHISGLYLKNECQPFEEMPFDASLSKHNPPLYDIISSIDSTDHDDEFLARKVKINTEQKVQLFTLAKDIIRTGDISENAEKFNKRLYTGHRNSRGLEVQGDNIFIKGYVNDTVWIIHNLLSRKGTGVEDYAEDMALWLESSKVDSDEKRAMLQRMFTRSNIALIYGAAGTGKTTLIRHIASYFEDRDKLFLANTNPATENLRRNIDVDNSWFSTIASSPALLDRAYDVVFIDECSTVDNRAMKKLLENLSCDLLVLVGDIYQIQSVRFGNWFGLARYFLPEEVVYELKYPYRSENPVLRELWHHVRTLDPKVGDFLIAKGFVSDINDDLFKKAADDEIVLCLNYDGLYGINNVNRFMQNDNPNPPVEWGTGIYKVGDPIIFDEYNSFYPVLYNNLKGRILHIEKSRTDIEFDVEVDCKINRFSAGEVGLEVVEYTHDEKTIVRFTVNRFFDDDESEKQKKQVVPFQVAYAVSIHKAQGLEYDSVKVLITDESEEKITHNIFYTAITRARKYLKIFWEYPTQAKVLKNMEMLSYARDASILSQRYSLKMNKKVKFD